MSDSPTGMEGLIAPIVLQESGLEPIPEGQHPDAGLSQAQGIPEQQPYEVQMPQKVHILQIWASLLIVICLGCLGTLSLVPLILPGLIPAPPTSGLAPGNIYMPASLSGPFKESECTARPTDMKYQPGPAEKVGDDHLPPVWFQAGRNLSDLAYAQACAASFVIAYQTFNVDDPTTLATCTTMLTDGAKRRFYGANPTIQPDPHMNPMWQASMQQQSVRQAAQASQPHVLDVRFISKRLLVWMLIPYQRTLWIANNQPMQEEAQLTVLLMSVPLNGQGTGWQVSQWQDGDAVFKSPAFL